MHIELIGSTSAGKTTLAKGMVQSGRVLDVEIMMSDDFILNHVNLNWVSNDFVRRRLIEVYAFLVCLRVWRTYSKFYKCAFQAGFQSPGSRLYKLNRVRNAIRKIGIYEIIHKRASERQVILVDNEGVLQGAHNLFVHVSGQADARDLEYYVALAPLPDVVVYLKQDESVLLERTLTRGHQRVTDRDYAGTEHFIKQAVKVFDEIIQIPRVRSKSVVLTDKRHIHVSKGVQDYSLLLQASKLIQAGIDAVAFNESPQVFSGQQDRLVKPELNRHS